jgi:hypothetical protein
VALRWFGGFVDAVWMYVIIAVAAVVAIAAIVVVSVVLWRRQVRRLLISLTGRRAAVLAAYRALESVFTSLAEADSEELTAFAMDASSMHRKALEELHSRMRMQSEELAELALPKKLWEAAGWGRRPVLRECSRRSEGSMSPASRRPSRRPRRRSTACLPRTASRTRRYTAGGSTSDTRRGVRTTEGGAA